MLPTPRNKLDSIWIMQSVLVNILGSFIELHKLSLSTCWRPLQYLLSRDAGMSKTLFLFFCCFCFCWFALQFLLSRIENILTEERWGPEQDWHLWRMWIPHLSDPHNLPVGYKLSIAFRWGNWRLGRLSKSPRTKNSQQVKLWILTPILLVPKIQA